jgi:hypothetical protein
MNISNSPNVPLERAMAEVDPQTVPPMDDFYEVLRKDFEAWAGQPIKSFRPIDGQS